jgi:hypothetical protein
MATKKVSALTALTSPDGSEELLINDGGTSKKVTITNANKKLFSFLDANGNYIQMQKGGDIASASPTVIDTDGDYFICTGTTGFTTFTVAADRHFFLEFAAALTMTHGAGTLDLPGGANITTAASDVGEFYSTASNVVTCVNYTKADGTPIAVNIVDDTTPQLGGDLDVNGNDIVSTTNADIDIIPHGTGDVNLGADTVQVGDNNADATITTQGTGDLILNTNNGTNAGNITLADGANGDISITPNGTGSVDLDGAVTINESGADVDFRVESDGNANMLLVDGGDNQVKVGTSGAMQSSGLLDVRNSGACIEFGHSNNSAGYFGTLGSYGNNGKPYIGFSVSCDYSANTFSTFGAKGSLIQGDLNGRMIFYSVDTADATGQTPTERMRIDSSGNVGIGDTDPSEAKLSIDNVLTGDSGLKVVRNLDEAGSYPLVNIVDDHASNTQPALSIQQDGAGRGIQIDQNGDNIALIIDSESTSYNAIYVAGKYPIQCVQDISGGYAGYFTRNLAEAGTNPLVQIIDDHASNTQTALRINQDGAGKGLLIDQNGNSNALYIDCESAGEYAIKANSKWGIGITQDISGGSAATFNRDIAEAGSYPLVNIIDDNASNTQPALKIQQDGAGYGLEIDQNGNNYALRIDSAATTFFGMAVSADTLTTGSIASFYSNSADTSTRNLVRIWNDNPAATGTTALKVVQDSTGAAITVEGGNIVIGTAGKGIDFSNQTATSATGAATTAEVLDHYEEGTWTPTTNNYSGSISNVRGSYVKIGKKVFIDFFCTTTDDSSTTGSFSFSGLPFTSDSTTSAYSTFAIHCYNNPNGTAIAGCQIATSSTNIRMLKKTSATSPTWAEWQGQDVNSGEINLSFSYST